MRHSIVLILLPFFIHSQQYRSSNFGSSDIERTNTRNRLSEKIKLNIIGSKFYHDKFISTTVNGKEIKVKYDALDDYMRSQVGPNLFTFPKNEILLLDNSELEKMKRDGELRNYFFELKRVIYLYARMFERAMSTTDRLSEYIRIELDKTS